MKAYIVKPQIEKPIKIDIYSILRNLKEDDIGHQKVDISGTRTCYCEIENIYDSRTFNRFKQELTRWYNSNKHLVEKDRHSLYYEFFIPKKTGGYRKIDAPEEELKTALKDLDTIIKRYYPHLYHTSAFAYIGKHFYRDDDGSHVCKGRSVVDCVRKHQNNQSNWILKTDFSDFFGSTNKKFAIKMLGMIYPFCFLPDELLNNVFELCFLNDSLPQGTPISPSLTNMIMIPIDFALFNYFNERKIVYTRYADDIYVSSVEKLDPNMMVSEIKKVLAEFEAPYKIKKEKTKYVSNKGANWMLGVMYNKDHNITVGNEKRKYFEAKCTNLIVTHLNKEQKNPELINEIIGLYSWYHSIEKETIEKLIRKLETKFKVNFFDDVCKLV